ncbi:oxidative stress survival, Svf1-like protein [Zopfochytrium polystomum]|nr:oxidative stress survival, Svf1-like protein [Zopfochytrium polystomum]
MWAALGFGGGEDEQQQQDQQQRAAPAGGAPADPEADDSGRLVDRKPTQIPVNSILASDDDLKWVVEHSGATEGQTWYTHLAGGGFVFVQLVYSSVGLSTSTQITARYYGPTGTNKSKSMSPSSSAFQLSSDRLSVTCDTISVQYTPATKSHAIKLSGGRELSLDLVFTPVEGFVKLNDGTLPFFDGDAASGHVKAVFSPLAKVTGTITVDGVTSPADGDGFFVGALQLKPQCVGKWNFTHIAGKDGNALMLYEFEMPDGYGYSIDIASQGIIVHNGKTIALTTDNRSVQQQREYDSFSGYKIPGAFRIRWGGHTTTTATAAEGAEQQQQKPVSVELSVQPKKLLDKIDVLSELPWVLRAIIQTFITAPFVYSWYEVVDVVVKIDGEDAFKIEGGRMFLECSFLSSEVY